MRACFTEVNAPAIHFGDAVSAVFVAIKCGLRIVLVWQTERIFMPDYFIESAATVKVKERSYAATFVYKVEACEGEYSTNTKFHHMLRYLK